MENSKIENNKKQMNRKDIKIIIFVSFILVILFAVFLFLGPSGNKGSYDIDLELKQVSSDKDIEEILKRNKQYSVEQNGCESVDYKIKHSLINSYVKSEEYGNTTAVNRSTIYYLSSTQIDVFTVTDGIIDRTKSIKFANAKQSQYDEINNKLFVNDFSIIILSTITHNDYTSTTIYVYDTLKYNLTTKYVIGGNIIEAYLKDNKLYFVIWEEINGEIKPYYQDNGTLKEFEYNDIQYLHYAENNCYLYIGVLNLSVDEINIYPFISDRNVYVTYQNDYLLLTSSKYNKRSLNSNNPTAINTIVMVFSVKDGLEYVNSINIFGLAKESPTIVNNTMYAVIDLTNYTNIYRYEMNDKEITYLDVVKVDGSYIESNITTNDCYVITKSTDISLYNYDNFIKKLDTEYMYLKQISFNDSDYYFGVYTDVDGYRLSILNNEFIEQASIQMNRYDEIFNTKSLPFLNDSNRIFVKEIDGILYIGFGVISYDYQAVNGSVEYIIYKVENNEMKVFQTFTDKLTNSVIEKMVLCGDYYCLLSSKAATIYEFTTKFMVVSRYKVD